MCLRHNGDTYDSASLLVATSFGVLGPDWWFLRCIATRSLVRYLSGGCITRQMVLQLLVWVLLECSGLSRLMSL